MMTLAIPAFNAIRGGTDFTTGIYNIAGTLDLARSYAMANNTYVLVGIGEFSGAGDESAATQVSGTGRIEMEVIYSKTGTRPYQNLFTSAAAMNSWLTSYYGTGASFLPVAKLVTIPNIHLVDLQYNGTAALNMPATGGMVRPSLGNNGYYYDISNANGISFNSIAWPLGRPGFQYFFKNVIEFDPQGCARLFSTSNPALSSFPDSIPQYIEIGLQPAHGNLAAGTPANQTANAGEIAAIQINGLGSAVHIYALTMKSTSSRKIQGSVYPH